MWWRKLLHRLHIKNDAWLTVMAYTDAENHAIDIYNGWNHGFLSRHDALLLFTDEMLTDKGAALWHRQIWEHNEMLKK
jgi:hypothetical protein